MDKFRHFLQVFEFIEFTYCQKIKYIVTNREFTTGKLSYIFYVIGGSYFHPSVKILIDKNNSYIFKNIMDEYTKLEKYLTDITMMLEKISILHDINKYIKCLYNIIYYQNYLIKSMKIIEEHFIIFLEFLKENKKITDFEFYINDLDKLKKDFQYIILLLDYIFTESYAHINLMSASDKLIAKNTIFNIIKKNSIFINKLINSENYEEKSKYLDFFKFFFENDEFNNIIVSPFVNSEK